MATVCVLLQDSQLMSDDNSDRNNEQQQQEEEDRQQQRQQQASLSLGSVFNGTATSTRTDMNDALLLTQQQQMQQHQQEQQQRKEHHVSSSPSLSSCWTVSPSTSNTIQQPGQDQQHPVDAALPSAVAATVPGVFHGDDTSPPQPPPEQPQHCQHGGSPAAVLPSTDNVDPAVVAPLSTPASPDNAPLFLPPSSRYVEGARIINESRQCTEDGGSGASARWISSSIAHAVAAPRGTPKSTASAFLLGMLHDPKDLEQIDLPSFVQENQTTLSFPEKVCFRTLVWSVLVSVLFRYANRSASCNIQNVSCSFRRSTSTLTGVFSHPLPLALSFFSSCRNTVDAAAHTRRAATTETPHGSSVYRVVDAGTGLCHPQPGPARQAHPATVLPTGQVL